jgi:hypothetical protein
MWTTCFYLPAGFSKEIAAHAEVVQKKFKKHYDLAVDDWLEKNRRLFWIVCPNPVDRMKGGKSWSSKTFHL